MTPEHSCCLDGCTDRRVARLIGDSYACDRHTAMLRRGDNRELIAESAVLLAAMLADPRPIAAQMAGRQGRLL